MLGNMIPPIYAPNGSGGGGSAPVTNTTTTAFTGGAWTFTKTAEATTAEDIVTFMISDALTSYVRLRNYDNTDASFVPELVSINAGADPALVLTTDTGADTGTQPSLFLNLFNNGGTGTTRPALKLNYQASTLLEVSGTGGWTFTKTAQASTAETIATFGISDDASSLISFANNSATDGRFGPTLLGVHGVSSSVPGIMLIGQVATGLDSGTAPIIALRARRGGSTDVSVRPLLQVQKGDGSPLLDLLPLNSGANSALSWGTQTGAAPAFTTRSAGTRLIMYSAISGTKVDNAIGVSASGAANTYSVQEATASYAHDFYAGTTKIAYLRGDGFSVLTGGEIHKVRVATTTPVTCASGTDRYVVTKLAAPAAVAVTLPTAVTGQVITIQDGTGDAAANNITISPASGTINGAATLVINTNFGCKELFYDGATWLAR